MNNAKSASIVKDVKKAGYDRNACMFDLKRGRVGKVVSITIKVGESVTMTFDLK